MKKYIDADKLKAEMERQQRRLMVLSNTEQVDMRRDCALQNGVYDNILGIIDSLQQEQPEAKENSKFIFPRFLYARTKDNKTIDMSYAPQDMTAIEYVRSDSIEDEESATKRSVKEELLKPQREEEIKFVTEPSQYRAGVLDCINSILASLSFVVVNQEETDLDKEISHYIDESLAVKFPTTDIELIKKDIAYTARYFWNKGFNAKKNP